MGEELKCIISDYEVISSPDHGAYIESRLLDAGFDLNKRYDCIYDRVSYCTIYLQIKKVD